VTTALTLRPGVDEPVSSRGWTDRWLAAHFRELVAVRRHIHANPEPSGQEFATAALVADRLELAGLKPRRLAKGNGIICDIGRGGPIVALRADLDALCLPDSKQVPYRSTVDNVCHACGHDVHTTSLLGAGLALAELDRAGMLPGAVRLLFQPAEEHIPSGAPEMIAEGALKDVESIYAMHCAPLFSVGQVGVRPGHFTAALDKVEIKLAGRGGHTARPHLTADLVDALGRVVVNTPGLLSRRCDPRSGASMVFGAVHAGEAINTIPNLGFARATVRVLSRETWLELPKLVTDLVSDVVAGTGVTAEVEYSRGMPPVINDPVATRTISAAAERVLGEENVLEAELSMGAEDFSYYLEHVPGAMIRLGVRPRDAADWPDLHQSGFDVDEDAIGNAVRVFVEVALANRG
jgi:amidohydrolase